MPTRLKKPSILKQLAVTAVLSAFLAYLGTNAVSGQFGLVGQDEMRREVTALEAHRATLQAEIDALRHRMTLLDPAALDPDLLTERAHALLSMAHPEDILLLPSNN
jgi:cell division protein FtsB